MRALRICLTLGSVALVSGCIYLQPDLETAPEPSPTAESAHPTALPVESAAPAVEANVPVDSGPRENASGEVTVDASGVPVEYVVAPDDNAGAICNRLGVRWWQLDNLDGERLGVYPVLHPGQAIVVTQEPGQPHDELAANALC